jgi:hypothetical protein
MPNMVCQIISADTIQLIVEGSVISIEKKFMPLQLVEQERARWVARKLFSDIIHFSTASLCPNINHKFISLCYCLRSRRRKYSFRSNQSVTISVTISEESHSRVVLNGSDTGLVERLDKNHVKTIQIIFPYCKCFNEVHKEDINLLHHTWVLI